MTWQVGEGHLGFSPYSIDFFNEIDFLNNLAIRGSFISYIFHTLWLLTKFSERLTKYGLFVGLTLLK